MIRQIFFDNGRQHCRSEWMNKKTFETFFISAFCFRGIVIFAFPPRSRTHFRRSCASFPIFDCEFSYQRVFPIWSGTFFARNLSAKKTKLLLPMKLPPRNSSPRPSVIFAIDQRPKAAQFATFCALQTSERSAYKPPDYLNFFAAHSLVWRIPVKSCELSKKQAISSCLLSEMLPTGHCRISLWLQGSPVKSRMRSGKL